MSKWSDRRDRDGDRRLARAVIVEEFGPASALDYLRAESLADDGREI